MKDVIIIGLGPAGITATLYLLRARLNILCLERLTFGGQINLTDRIENYPGFPEGIKGFELAQIFKKQIDKFSPQIFYQEVIGIEKKENFIIKTTDSEYYSRGVIITTGARPKKLNIEGEENFAGKGLSYCATCDAPFFKEKEIAVVGGGNSAIEEAIYLSKFVRKIHLIHRRDKLRADKILQERIYGLKNIEFHFDSRVEKIGGRNKVEYISIRNLKTGNLIKLSLEGIFIFVGYTPNTEFVKKFLKLDSDGYIITDESFNASVKGIFSAGDVRSGSLKQVVSACGEGAKSAVECIKYIEKLKAASYD